MQKSGYIDHKYRNSVFATYSESPWQRKPCTWAHGIISD